MTLNWFCDIYSSIKDKRTFLKKIRFYSLLRWLTRYTANFVLPITFCLRPTKTTLSKDTKPSLIVSLTSFPARIDRLWLTIECIFRQTVLPDTIILWLSKEQFTSIEELPTRLKAYQAKGLDIRLVENDFRSHKKYVYALQQYPEANLITIDDDLFYRSTLIEDLMAEHKVHPNAIIAHYTHNIRYDHHGNILPYAQWENNVTEGESLFFGSGGGTLFPPHSLYTDVTDIQTAMQQCPNADDIWLNAMARINNTPIMHAGRKDVYLPVIQRNKYTLFSTNEFGGNDKQLHQVVTYCIKNYHKNPFTPSK